MLLHFLNPSTNIDQFIIRCFLSLECFAAFGVNCSLPCAPAAYGYQCKYKCTCAYNEVCDRYAGCVRLGGLPFKLKFILLLCLVFICPLCESS